MQYPYDPGTLPSSANQCILGKVYLYPIYQDIPQQQQQATLKTAAAGHYAHNKSYKLAASQALL